MSEFFNVFVIEGSIQTVSWNAHDTTTIKMWVFSCQINII